MKKTMTKINKEGYYIGPELQWGVEDIEYFAEANDMEYIGFPIDWFLGGKKRGEACAHTPFPIKKHTNVRMEYPKTPPP